MIYPSHWAAPQVGEHLEVFHALAGGRLTATGRTGASISIRQSIPEAEWVELVPDVRGP